MLSIIYVSVADPLIGSDDIKAILDSARRNNARDGLTGALLYTGYNFMQLLEGPADKLGACLQAIREDPRHSGMVEIRRRQIEQRDFADWSMLYASKLEGGEDLRHLAAGGRIDAQDERILANFIALGQRS